MSRLFSLVAILTLPFGALAANAFADDAVPRTTPVVGDVLEVKHDEKIRFVDASRWRDIAYDQDLSPGDELRTGPNGGLAILFQDDTQIRVHQNSHLTIRNLARRSGGKTQLLFGRGAIWNRSQKLPRELQIETPTATAAIRGTEWYMRVDEEGATTLVVLAGEVDLFNAHAEVKVRRGEKATVAVGQGPVKSKIVDFEDRPFLNLFLTEPTFISFHSGRSYDWLLAERERLGPEVEHCREVHLSGQNSACVDGAALAAVLYDLGYWPELAETIPSIAAASVRSLFTALLALQQHRYQDALSALPERGRLSGSSSAVAANLVRYGALLGLGQFEKAQGALATMPPVGHPDVILTQAWQQYEQGRHEKAMALLQQGAEARPGDVRFSLALAQMHLFLAEREGYGEAVANAAAVDGETPSVLHAQALQAKEIMGDYPTAVRLYEQSLQRNPYQAEVWNDLALARHSLGQSQAALVAIAEALALAPHLGYLHANKGLILLGLDDLKGARQALQEGQRLAPGLAETQSALGLLALSEGREEEALQFLLAATAVNPTNVQSHTALAIALYQARRTANARAMLQTAARQDPRDPVPHLVASIIAQDQAEAGAAIRAAQAAQANYAQWRDGAFTPLQGAENDQNGIMSLGSAYGFLGLSHWGATLAEQAYDPYGASNYFYRGLQYPLDGASQGTVLQGLLLDPLAVSAPTRDNHIYRKPFSDLTVGGHAGNRDSDRFSHGLYATYQGFTRDPRPISYYFDMRQDFTEGVDGGQNLWSRSFQAAVGAQLTPRQWVLGLLGGQRTEPQTPLGNEDAVKSDSATAALAYSYRISVNNRVFARVAYDYAYANQQYAAPFGAGLSFLDYSLLRAYGEEQVRAWYGEGICDAGELFGLGLVFPAVLFADNCNNFGFSLLSSELPETINTDPTVFRSQQEKRWALQFRHLFDHGPVHWTYGLEWTPATTKSKLAVLSASESIPFDENPEGGGFIFFPDGSVDRFPYYDAINAQSAAAKDSQSSLLAYGDARWRIAPAWQLEGGLRFHRIDAYDFIASDSTPDSQTVESDADTKLAPRLGLAWQPGSGHWLRAAAYRHVRGLESASLAPYPVVGLITPQDALAVGGHSDNLQLRWDSQWTPRIFTFAEYLYQDLEKVSIAPPLSGVLLGSGLIQDESIRRRGSLGANFWLGERFGLALRHRWIWGELPYDPEQSFDAQLTWVHPAQIRVSLAQHYEGERQTDFSGQQTLPSWWSTNLYAQWRPWHKHLDFTLSVENLFDEEHLVEAGYPEQGRTILFGMAYHY